MQRNSRSQGQAREVVRARTDARASSRGTTRTGAAVDRRSDSNLNGIPDYREQRLADINGNGIPDYRERGIVDLNGNGIPDYRERRIDRDRDGIDDRAQSRYGANSCPPGLAKRNNGCLPPGQERKLFAEGQRLPTGYNYYTPYDRIPREYRDQYGLDENGRYIYRDGRLYDVDPTTSIVRRIIEGLRF
jgi:hypothetical protein